MPWDFQDFLPNYPDHDNVKANKTFTPTRHAILVGLRQISKFFCGIFPSGLCMPKGTRKAREGKNSQQKQHIKLKN